MQRLNCSTDDKTLDAELPKNEFQFLTIYLARATINVIMLIVLSCCYVGATSFQQQTRKIRYVVDPQLRASHVQLSSNSSTRRDLPKPSPTGGTKWNSL